MQIVIIVEGKRDKTKLRKLLSEEVMILCTYGTPGTDQLELLKNQAGPLPIYIYTDNDPSGKKIRYLLREQFPDAEHLYTSPGFAGVEGTPEESVIKQLEKADLHEYIIPQSML